MLLHTVLDAGRDTAGNENYQLLMKVSPKEHTESSIKTKSVHILAYPERQCEGWWVWLSGMPGDPADGETMTESEGLSLAWPWPEDHVGEQSWPMVDSWHAGQPLGQNLCLLVSFLEHLQERCIFLVSISSRKEEWNHICLTWWGWMTSRLKTTDLYVHTQLANTVEAVDSWSCSLSCQTLETEKIRHKFAPGSRWPAVQWSLSTY